MKTNLKEVNSFTRQLDVIVAWNLISDDFDKEFNKARSTYSIPGFRKGKVPAKIVKQNLGTAIEAHFAEHSIDTYYQKALDELKINPINQATINDFKFQEGNELSFTAQFEVEPEMNLPKYQKKFKVKVIRNIAAEEDVKQALAQYQERHANIKTIDTGAETGHFIRGDFQRVDDSGLPIEGSVMENQYIRLGFGLFKDEAETVFLGGKEGDEIIVSIPGKDNSITYKVTINKVEEQLLPELDDEFAKTVNENTNTLDELKTRITEQIQSSLDKEHKEAINREIINYFVENSKLDTPDSMVTKYLHHVKEDLEKQKQSVDEEELNEKYKSHAEWNIKWYLIKEKLIENESLGVSEEEINAKIQEMASLNGEQESKIKSFYRQAKNRQDLYNQMLNDKLFDKLSEYAKVKVVEQSTDELRKKQVENKYGE